MAPNKRKTPKPRKIHESMESIVISDDVLRNMLSRLSAKPLMRFRCASMHWNSLITDPYFINSRSRRMILMHSHQTRLYAFDPNHQNIVKLTYPFEHQIDKCKIIGTLNGIFLLVLEKYFFGPSSIFILYNPVTRATKELPGLPHPCCFTAVTRCAYGFGQGNIIAAKGNCCFCPSNSKYNNCNVFSLKKGSWTTPKTTFAGSYRFLGNVGMFLNGFLHWIALRAGRGLDIVVLDVTEIVVTRMDTPCRSIDSYYQRKSVLGTLHGCLCMCSMWRNGFDVWVKEQSEWSKQYSFALPFYRYGCPNCLDICILEEGRILVKDGVSNQIIMCHLFERYYDIFKCAYEIRDTNRFGKVKSTYEYDEKPFEYVESLVSPSDICNV